MKQDGGQFATKKIESDVKFVGRCEQSRSLPGLANIPYGRNNST